MPPRAGANSEPSTARSASPPASPAARSLANRRPSLPKSSLPSASASLARRTACLKPDSISPAIPRLADCAREVRRDNAVSTAPTPCGPARPLKLRRTSTPARLNSPTSPFAASRLRSAASATAPRSSASSRACARLSRIAAPSGAGIRSSAMNQSPCPCGLQISSGFMSLPVVASGNVGPGIGQTLVGRQQQAHLAARWPTSGNGRPRSNVAMGQRHRPIWPDRPCWQKFQIPAPDMRCCRPRLTRCDLLHPPSGPCLAQVTRAPALTPAGAQ